jgi:hypothetical protein
VLNVLSHAARQLPSWLIFDVRQRKMKYPAALALSGILWTAIALALGGLTVPFFPAAAAGIATAFVVGLLVKSPIKKVRGWLWFALPFASIALGAAVFALFLVGGSWVLATLTPIERVEAEPIYVSALLYVYLSLTSFVWATYPASLLTHYLLRRYALQKSA